MKYFITLLFEILVSATGIGWIFIGLLNMIWGWHKDVNWKYYIIWPLLGPFGFIPAWRI